MVIQQYPITITPKYNFPQENVDAVLPQQFTLLSINSLTRGHSLSPQPDSGRLELNCGFEDDDQPWRFKPFPISLKSNSKECLVASADTSTMKIAETMEGTVIAVRGANVWRQNHRYHYTRLGPFVFHITEENKKEVLNSLEGSYFGSSKSSRFPDSGRQASPSFLQMPTRIASLLERWLQLMLCKSISNGVILFDGSLTSGTLDTPVQRLKEILTVGRRHGNVVLAFSKMTSLRIGGRLITDLLPRHNPPYLLETSNLRLNPPFVLLGQVYVAKLTNGSCAFRLDIDKEVPPQIKIEAVEKLLGNDMFSQSYPETLRLAHILCTFTANEVLAMQHFIARKHGLQIINRPDMHRLLFGIYGKGEGFS